MLRAKSKDLKLMVRALVIACVVLFFALSTSIGYTIRHSPHQSVNQTYAAENTDNSYRIRHDDDVNTVIDVIIITNNRHCAEDGSFADNSLPCIFFVEYDKYYPNIFWYGPEV